MSEINIKRIWAMPNKWTFNIQPIKELLDKYVHEGIYIGGQDDTLKY